jgi:hypothetical protein
MKIYQRKKLLEELSAEVRNIVLQAEKMKGLELASLECKPAPMGWSAGQCVKHLNVYCEYYIPAIAQCLEKGAKGAQELFKPGWLGNYFTQLMRVLDNGHLKKKMKSPANANPPANVDSIAELETFIEYQHQLLDLIDRMTNINLNQRIPISISKIIRLKLGDVLLFFVTHENRHMAQARRTLGKSL